MRSLTFYDSNIVVSLNIAWDDFWLLDRDKIRQEEIKHDASI